MSILLCYDLEPCHDIICAKFSNIKGISYPFFKECLYNFLDNKEYKLNTMFLAEQNSVPLENVKQINNNIPKNNENDNIDVEDIKMTDDLSQIFLHRSLFILKKKFEQNKFKIKEIYNKYKEIFPPSEKNDNILENEIIVDKDLVGKILIEILNCAKFEIASIKNYKEVFIREMQFSDKISIDDNILNKFMDFVTENRRKYNYIYKEKKINKNFNLESYIDYIPQGDDELTKVIIETSNKKNIDQDNKNDTISLNIPLNNNRLKITNIKENQIELENISNLDESNNNDEKKITTLKKELLNKPVAQKSIEPLSEDETDFCKNEIKYYKYYLYIESLFLIIADFISKENNNYIILEHNDELRNDLRTLFDNEILGRMGEDISTEVNRYKMEQLKELLLNKEKVQKNISCYEDLLYQMRSHNQNVNYVLITINKLKDAMNWLDKKINVIQDDTNTYNEYENNLKLQKLNKDVSNIQNKSKIINVNESFSFNSQSTNRNNNEENNEDIVKLKETQNMISCNINNNNVKTENNVNNKKVTIEKNDNEEIKSLDRKSNFVSRRLSELSILKLDKNIENVDTNRLNLIDNNNKINKSPYDNYNNSNSKTIEKPKRQVTIPKIKNKNDMSKEEIRESNLFEIFNFYSHQHSCAGHKSTFDSIRDKFEHMNLSEFSKFCVEFKLLIPKEKLIEIFKKCATLTKEMSFQEFQVALSKMSVAVNEYKIKQIKKRIFHYKNSLNYNNKNMAIENLKKEQVEELILKCKEDIKVLNKKSYDELLEEFYQYIEIDNENNYRPKMKGFMLPFNYNKNNQKITPNIIKNKNVPVKVNLGKQFFIKDMIEKRKEEKENIEKNVKRVNGLDREYQQQRIDKLNKIMMSKSLINHNKKLEPIKKDNKSIYSENIFNKERYNMNDLKSNHTDTKSVDNKSEINKTEFIKINNNNKDLELNSFPRNTKDLITEKEAEKEVMDQLNFNPRNIKNNNPNIKGNKYTWNSLENMKMNSLVDETEMKKLIE